MLKERRMVAEQVANALFEAEVAIDAAIVKTTELAGSIPALRGKINLAAQVGQDAFERATSTIAALTEARRAIVETHNELSQVQKQIGLGAVALGPPLVKIEPSEDAVAHGRNLRVA